LSDMLEVVEGEEEGDATRRDRHDPERGFRDDPEGAFAADEQGREREDAVVERVRETHEVVSARVLADRAATRNDGLAMIRDLLPYALQPAHAADHLSPFRSVHGNVVRVDRGPVREEDLQSRDMIPRLAILHAPISGGVVADPAADPAQLLAARIRGESHPAFRQVRVQLGEQDAAFDADEPTVRIELEDAMES